MSTLYIIRGLPGSGKSTLARKLVHPSRHREADQFFITDGAYRYDPSRIKEAHQWCQDQVKELLRDNADCCVSNTFVKRWEYQRYIDMAEEAGHSVQIIECHGPWSNVHDVPCDVITAMRLNWEPHAVL